MTTSTKKQWQELSVVCAIILVATFLRVYRLDQIPPGLHYDEAFKGVEARHLLAGAGLPVFFPDNFGELPLRIYATASSFALFGESPWSLRLVSAFAGILTVAAVYALARALFRAKKVAALTALTMAILYWHVNFSRLGMEPILMPLLLTLAFALLWRGLRSRSSFPLPNRNWSKEAGWFALSGICFGATLYTYQASFFVPILIATFAVVEALVNRQFWSQRARDLAILVVAAILTVVPLGFYLVSHPNQLTERPRDVAIASPELISVMDNALNVASMFTIRGDENPRSNLPFRPALDPFLALGFIVGLAICGVRIRRVESRLLLLWLLVMALPSVLTDFAPHFGRAIGVIPALAMIIALAFTWLFQMLPGPRWVLGALLIVGVAMSTYSTVHDYFDIWGTGTGLFDSFDSGYLTLAQKLHDRPADETVYLSPVDVQNYTIRFGLNGRAVHSFDSRHVLVLPPPGSAVTYGVVTREDPRLIARLESLFPEGKVVDTIRDLSGKPYATIWHAEAMPQISAQNTVRARFGDMLDLTGYNLVREEGAIGVTIQWASVVEMREDYTVFVHLIGPANPASEPRVWAQEDAQPGHGSYPTTRWKVGETAIDEYRLAIPTDAPAGKYQIEIGLYSYKTGVRLAVTDPAGTSIENDRVLLDGIMLP